MDKFEIKETTKKIILRVTIAFVIVVAILTYFSNTIDYTLLPRVTCTNPQGGYISYALNTTSKLEYKDIKVFSLPSGMIVEEVFVTEGQSIKKGEKIAKLNTETFAQEKDVLYLDILRLTNQLNALYSSYNSAKTYEERTSLDSQIQETELQIKIAKAPYDRLIDNTDEKGNLLASENMIITKIFANEESLFEYAKSNASQCFSFEVSNSLSEKIRINSSLDVKINIKNDNGEIQKKSFNAKIDSKVENNETGDFLYTATLGKIELEEGENNPSFGDEVLIDTTISNNDYDIVIAKTCLQQDDKEYFVYVVNENDDGTFYIGKESVNILEQNDFYCAVEGNLYSETKIVLTTTKPLSEGQRVLIDE